MGKRCLEAIAFFVIAFFWQIDVTHSQVQKDWVTLRDDKLGFALSFPSNYLVDNESEKSFILDPVLGSLPRVVDSQTKTKIFGYMQSAFMTLRVTELRPVSSAKDFIWFFAGPNNSTETRQQFRAGDFVGIKLTRSQEAGRYFSRVIFAKGNKILDISCFAKSKDKDAYDRFLRSLVLDGNEVFGKQGASQQQYVVSFSELKTSPEISAMLTLRKRQKIKVTRVPSLESLSAEDGKEFTRPLIILRQPPFLFTTPGAKPVETVKLRVTFLASGEISEIEVANDVSDPFVKSVVESTKKTIFLPAEIDGKKVDLVRTQEHKFKKN